MVFMEYVSELVIDERAGVDINEPLWFCWESYNEIVNKSEGLASAAQLEEDLDLPAEDGGYSEYLIDTRRSIESLLATSTFDLGNIISLYKSYNDAWISLVKYLEEESILIDKQTLDEEFEEMKNHRLKTAVEKIEAGNVDSGLNILHSLDGAVEKIIEDLDGMKIIEIWDEADDVIMLSKYSVMVDSLLAEKSSLLVKIEDLKATLSLLDKKLSMEVF